MRRSTRRLLAALAAALLVPLLATGCAALNGRYQPKGRPVLYRGHFMTLPSGLRVVVYEMPQVERFVLSVTYRAGAVDDPAGKEGLAHLAEHLAFRAAPQGAGAPIWQQLIASGMAFNGVTSMDQTDYWIAGKPQELPAALRIEAARMKDPLAGVSEDDLAIERDVVLAEYRERFETSLEAAQEQWVRELAFAGHPYAHSIAGTPASLKAISLADVRAWTKARYDPAGVVMVVISPFPAEDAARRVVAAFEPLFGDPASPRQPIAYAPPTPPAVPARAPLAVRTAPVHQTELWVGWPVPGTYAGLGPRLEVIRTLLEAYVADRLTGLLVNGAVDDFDVDYLPMDGAGMMLVRVSLHDPDQAEKALESVRFAGTEVKLGAGRPWVARMAQRMLVRSYVELEQMRVSPISRFVRATGQSDYLGDWSRRVVDQLGGDADWIAPLAEAWLVDERAAAVLVKPDGGVRARDLAGGAAPPPAYADPLEEETASLPPPPPEQVRAVLRSPGLARAERRTLANGLQVAFLDQGSLPVGDVRLAVRTPVEGSLHAPLGAPGLALACSDEVSFVGEKMRKAGLTRSWQLRPEAFVLGGRGASGNLGDLVEIEGRWASKVALQGPAFESVRKYLARVSEGAERAPLERARRALLARLFPTHPYGASPGAADVRARARGEASGWLETALRPERATLVVVSDVKPSPEGWSWIEGEFGRWERGGAGPVPPAPIAPVPAARGGALVERRGATTAVVTVAFRMPALAERDEAALEAVRWLLQSRLNQRIRVEEGVSYGVSVGAIERRQAAALVVTAVVESSATASTVQTILRAAQELAREPLLPAAAARARWKVARGFASRFETVADAADALEEIALHGLPADYYDRMPEQIASLDGARIRAAAGSLALGREVVVVSGAAGLRPQLAAAGLDLELLAEPAR